MNTPTSSKPLVAALLRLGPLCLSFALCAQAAPRSSTAYTIPAEALNSAGPRATSTAYGHDGDLDMLGTSAGSASYTLGGGFRDAAQDSTAPTLTLPASTLVATATSASGAAVTFSVTAIDDEDGTLTPTLSAISGAVFPLGDTLVMVSATDSAGNTAGGSFIVRVRTPLQDWKLTQLGDANAPDLGDPDNDGLATLSEYALVMPPGMPSLPPGASRFTYAEGVRLRMLLPRDPARHDVTIEVLGASDLAGPWASVATSTLGAPFTGPGYVGGDAATPGVKTVEVRDVVNIADAPQRFLRVRVSR